MLDIPSLEGAINWNEGRGSKERYSSKFLRQDSIGSGAVG